MNALLLLSLIAATAALKYVKNGAVLTEPGTLKLNNPSPLLTIRINNYQQCTEEPIICLNSQGSRPTLLDQCQANYCNMRFDFALKLSELGVAVIEGNSMVFKQSVASKCVPDVTDGLHTYQIVSLPQNCEVMIVGATDPTPPTESSEATSTESTTALTTTEAPEQMSATIKIVIAICVMIIVILLVISGGTIFFFVIKPRMQRNAERRRQAANARDVEAGESTNLIAHPAPKAVKTKPKAKLAKSKKAKSKEAKSAAAPTTTVTIQKTEANEMKKEPSVQKPASSFEPAPKPSESKTTAPQEDRTQDSPTGSEGTPPADQKTAPQMKQSSVFKPNHYIPRAQASVPYKRLRQPDSLDQVVPASDTVLASLQRLERVSPTVQMVVAAGWKLDVDHVMSRLEKNIFREHIDIATDSLEALIRQLDAGLLTHGAQYGSNDTSPVTWEWVNEVTTPASAAYRLFIMSYPEVTDNIEASSEDPLIKNLSVPGLYALLFYDGFDREFKSELILEVKARRCRLFNEVPANNLVGSAFPLPYMARRYQKDKTTFIIGRRSTIRK
uniref:Rap-GAP domain-containing protein n=3 Tax=Panagrellus redivivus TaxID=6233 RepID=A0A7E4VEW5_PANRE